MRRVDDGRPPVMGRLFRYQAGKGRMSSQLQLPALVIEHERESARTSSMISGRSMCSIEEDSSPVFFVVLGLEDDEEEATADTGACEGWWGRLGEAPVEDGRAGRNGCSKPVW